MTVFEAALKIPIKMTFRSKSTSQHVISYCGETCDGEARKRDGVDAFGKCSKVHDVDSYLPANWANNPDFDWTNCQHNMLQPPLIWPKQINFRNVIALLV